MREPRRVAMVSDHLRQGGAARAAERLAHGLRDRDAGVTRFFTSREAQAPDARACRAPFWLWASTGILARLGGRCLSKRLRRGPTVRRLLSAVDRERPGVINLHNLHGFLDSPLPLLPACRKRPVVWTLHDMWSFTGRCAFAYECPDFATGCGASCPTPHEYPALAPRRIGHAWAARQRFLQLLPDATAVCPSRWLADQAQSGLWHEHRVRVIPNGLDLGTFRPAARAEARRGLGMPEQGLVLAFGAQNLQDKRKGGELLRAALAGVDGAVTLATFGQPPTGHPAPDHRWHHLGEIRGENDLARVYNAADVFVHPSVADNLPLVLLEAVACGTPCVGMPVGGVPEVVREAETGWLAEAATAEALRAALLRAIKAIHRGRLLRDECRRIAEQEYGLERQAQRYLDLFDELLDNHDRPQAGAAPTRKARPRGGAPLE